MSTYISGGLTLVLLALVLGISLQVADIYRVTRAVDTSLQFAELAMGIDGCVSSRAVQLLQGRLQREGLQTELLTLNSTTVAGRPRVPWGGEVSLEVVYREPRQILGNLTWRNMELVVARRVTTISGWVDTGANNDRCS